MKNWWKSSKDAEKLSLTIKGFMTGGVIGAIVLVLNLLSVKIDATDINSLVSSVQGVIVGIGGLGAAIMSLYGIIRKIYLKVK